MLSLEQSWTQVLIKPNFCFNALDADTLKKLLSDTELYNGKADLLYEIHKKRHEIFCRKNRRHIGIYTVQGITDFLKTGKLSDHVSVMRPFTEFEAKAVLKTIIDICETNPMNQIYLLRSNINYNDFQYTFFGQSLLYFCDGYTNYDGMNYSYITNSNQIVSIFHNFIKNELIPKHCYPANESLQIMKEML